MSQNTKYIISIVSLLFLFTVGYSAFVIYQNKYNHNGSRFSLINLITGKDSTPDSLKKTKTASQTASQLDQYNAKGTSINQDTAAANTQKLLVINFYNDFVDNAKNNAGQTGTLSKYGTTNLTSEYINSGSEPETFTCTAKSVFNSSLKVENSATMDGGWYVYTAVFIGPDQQILSNIQINLTAANNNYLIDKISCLK